MSCALSMIQQRFCPRRLTGFPHMASPMCRILQSACCALLSACRLSLPLCISRCIEWHAWHLKHLRWESHLTADFEVTFMTNRHQFIVLKTRLRILIETTDLVLELKPAVLCSVPCFPDISLHCSSALRSSTIISAKLQFSTDGQTNCRCTWCSCFGALEG